MFMFTIMDKLKLLEEIWELTVSPSVTVTEPLACLPI